LDTITQPVLGKFPIKVNFPMTIYNSVMMPPLSHSADGNDVYV
jgi:hypothetical protein